MRLWRFCCTFVLAVVGLFVLPGIVVPVSEIMVETCAFDDDDEIEFDGVCLDVLGAGLLLTPPTNVPAGVLGFAFFIAFPVAVSILISSFGI